MYQTEETYINASVPIAQPHAFHPPQTKKEKMNTKKGKKKEDTEKLKRSDEKNNIDIYPSPLLLCGPHFQSSIVNKGNKTEDLSSKKIPPHTEPSHNALYRGRRHKT
jgi:hypothetical protein